MSMFFVHTDVMASIFLTPSWAPAVKSPLSESDTEYFSLTAFPVALMASVSFFSSFSVIGTSARGRIRLKRAKDIAKEPERSGDEQENYRRCLLRVTLPFYIGQSHGCRGPEWRFAPKFWYSGAKYISSGCSWELNDSQRFSRAASDWKYGSRYASERKHGRSSNHNSTGPWLKLQSDKILIDLDVIFIRYAAMGGDQGPRFMFRITW